jgi:hypothetical protein
MKLKSPAMPARRRRLLWPEGPNLNLFFQAGKRFVPLAVSAAMLACSGSTPVAPATTDTTTTTTAPTVASVSVDGQALLTGVAQRTQLAATTTLSDGTTQDVKNAAKWQSSDPTVAVVAVGGVVTTVSAGTATLTATSGGASGSIDLTIVIVNTGFQGTVLSSDGLRGTIALTIQGATSPASASSAQASGTFQIAGAATALSGVYSYATSTVSVSGEGFRFTGVVTDRQLSGTYAGPNGVAGSFAASAL